MDPPCPNIYYFLFLALNKLKYSKIIDCPFGASSIVAKLGAFFKNTKIKVAVVIHPLIKF
jgi:hypothetical protein